MGLYQRDLVLILWQAGQGTLSASDSKERGAPLVTDERVDQQIDRSLAAARRAMAPDDRLGGHRGQATAGAHPKPMPVSHDVFLDHYLKRIDPQVAASFSEAR